MWPLGSLLLLRFATSEQKGALLQKPAVKKWGARYFSKQLTALHWQSDRGDSNRGKLPLECHQRQAMAQW